MRSRATRYSIQRPLEFALQNGEISTSGQGRTVNISNGGLLFKSEDRLSVGARIELAVQLEEVEDTDTVVTLFAQGMTVRSDADGTAVVIKKHLLRSVGPDESKLR